MTIIRSARPQRDFTILSNSVCLDSRLSMRALGLLVRLLSRPDNWQTNSATLAREFDVGREQMQGVLRELSNLGYMELSKTRNPDGTFFSAWHVFDEPKTGTPDHGKPAPEKPYAGKPVAITRTDITSTDNKDIVTEVTLPPTATRCPQSEILKLWAEKLPEAIQPREWTPARQKLLVSRWKEKSKRQTLDYWAKLFDYIRESDFLMGRTTTNGRKAFSLTLQWVLKPENMAKIVEGTYHE